MACCDDGDSKIQGFVKQRKCRDLLFALLFFLFWVGMFVIAGFAWTKGDYNRALYSYDSFGLTCGAVNTLNGITIDLSAQRNKYYLDPFDLLDVWNLKTARSICVSGCPTNASVCAPAQMPCINGSQYYCPYFVFANNNISKKLTKVSNNNVTYYDALPQVKGIPYANIPEWNTIPYENVGLFTAAVATLGPPWVDALDNAGLIFAPGQPPPVTVNGTLYQVSSAVPNWGPCHPILASTVTLVNRCYPNIPKEWANDVKRWSQNVQYFSWIGTGVQAFYDQWNSVSERFNRYVDDISRGWLIVLVAGLLTGLVLSLVWILLMRYLSGVIVWLTVILANLALITFTLFCFAMAEKFGHSSWIQSIYDFLPNDPFGTTKHVWLIIGIVMAVVAGIVLIITLLVIRRIMIAIACIKVASQAAAKMPLLIFFPIIPWIWVCVLVVYWFAVLAMLWSAGYFSTTCRTADTYHTMTFQNLTIVYNNTDPVYTSPASCYQDLPYDQMIWACTHDPNCFVQLHWNTLYKGMFVYHMIGLLWTFCFITGFTTVTVAGAVGEFYWWAGGFTQVFSDWPIATSAGRAIFYHNGSIAFGSFLIAALWFIRIILEFLVNSLNEAASGSCCCGLQWLCCCCTSCLGCLQSFVAFLSKNAYVMVGVKGSNYCSSAATAVELIAGNILRVAVVTIVNFIVMWLGRILIAACGGVVAFGMSTADYYTNAINHPNTYLSSNIGPIAISTLVALIVAELFLSVYDTAIDTLILSFCEDCNANGGNPRHAPALLMEAVGMRPNPPADNKIAPLPLGPGQHAAPPGTQSAINMAYGVPPGTAMAVPPQQYMPPQYMPQTSQQYVPQTPQQQYMPQAPQQQYMSPPSQQYMPSPVTATSPLPPIMARPQQYVPPPPTTPPPVQAVQTQPVAVQSPLPAPSGQWQPPGSRPDG